MHLLYKMSVPIHSVTSQEEEKSGNKFRVASLTPRQKFKGSEEVKEAQRGSEGFRGVQI